MSDTSTQTDQGDPQDGDPNIRQLREKAKRADELEADNAAKDRKIAILESGIDVESPHGELFLKAYDGDLTGEAMKAAAEKYGIPLKGASPAPGEGGEVVEPAGGETPPDPIDPTGTAERRALSDGAPADTGEEKDPRQTSLDVFNQRLKENAPDEDAAAASLRVLVEAANAGDPRVVFDPQRKRAEAIQQMIAEGGLG